MKLNSFVLPALSLISMTHAVLDCSSPTFTTLLSSNQVAITFVQAFANNASFSPPGGLMGPPPKGAGGPPGGAGGPPKGFPFGPRTLRVPSLCALQAKVKSSESSEYSFGVFLPENWNGRFLAVGNGGFAGTISWNDMATYVTRGFAVVSTDAGTRPGGMGNASWAYNNPERVTDWGYRGLHGAVIMGKQIVRHYYSQDIKFSYYSGCSTGGRQGLKEAQLFPDDFDGIVAGAPAWWTTHLQLFNMKVGLYNLPIDATTHIPNSLFPIIQKEVMKQCDPQDGVVDSVISDPRRCRFRPEALICGSTTTTDCLTVPQLTTLDYLYNDWVEANQTFIFPHLELGSEFQWSMAIGSSVPSAMGTEYVKWFLNLGPDWKWQDYEPTIIQLSEKINPGNATADNFDMEPFYKKGGKLLHYHGWADGSIPPGSSIYFYDHVYRTLKPKGIDLDQFYRFFMVPGMGHCSGAASNAKPAVYFGASNQGMDLGEGNTANVIDSKHDVLSAMVDWVENKIAPEHIVGTAWTNDRAPGGVYRQRPLCMWPKQAKYKGSGDEKKPENWICAELY